MRVWIWCALAVVSVGCNDQEDHGGEATQGPPLIEAGTPPRSTLRPGQSHSSFRQSTALNFLNGPKCGESSGTSTSERTEP